MQSIPTPRVALLAVMLAFTFLASSADPVEKRDPGTRGRRAPGARSLVDEGRYLVKITGCNDCHTAGYAQSNAATPEADWLTGDSVGWRGPWGTTYATNLRLFMQDLSEDQWVTLARVMRARPPMPWFSMNAMRDRDLRAIYQFIKSLGPKGSPAPAALPPDQMPATPFIQFVPQSPK